MSIPKKKKQIDPHFLLRLKELMGEEKPYAWGKRIGMSKGAITRVFEEAAVPAAATLKKIRTKTGASIDWLLTGDGDKFSRALPAIETNAETEYISLPLYGVRAAAGGGSVVEGERVIDVLKFKREWITRELHANQKNLCLLYVDGDSMEPNLRPGDMILVDRGDTGPNRDGIYVLRMGESLLVKRLQRLPGGELRVTSDNERYEPFVLKAEEPENVAIVGRVVWAGRRM